MTNVVRLACHQQRRTANQHVIFEMALDGCVEAFQRRDWVQFDHYFGIVKAARPRQYVGAQVYLLPQALHRD
jgi:hypothetical protein